MAAACVRRGFPLRRSSFSAAGRALSVLTLGHRRKLNDIVKLEELAKEPPEAIHQVWRSFHADADTYTGHVLPAAAFSTLGERLTESPMLVFPVVREGGYFVLTMQHNEKSVCYTFLDEFRKDPETAQPWLFLSLFDELVESKGLGLLRGEVMPGRLTKAEAESVVARTIDVYSSDRYDRAWMFNHAPKHFDADAFIQEQVALCKGASTASE